MAEYIVRETGYPGAVKQEIVGELVRCKDCKYYDPSWTADGRRFDAECAFHEWYRAEPKEDDYCSKGERKE